MLQPRSVYLAQEKSGQNFPHHHPIPTTETEEKSDLELGRNGKDEDWTNYRICTWNLWCIPCRPRTLSNPDRCSSYLKDLIMQESWDDYDGLVIVALQELWCWRLGVFPPFVLRLVALLEYIPYIGFILSSIFQIISLLLGVLPILKCLPIIYDPKKRFIRKLRRHFPYAVKDNTIPISTFLDNGLLLLLNKKPTSWGFECYEACACDDSLANKGWLWAYFEKKKFLVINTHMQAAGAGRERLMQIRELKHWLYHKWEKKGLVDKAIILGDFNIDMESHPERLRIFQGKAAEMEKLDLLEQVQNQVQIQMSTQGRDYAFTASNYGKTDPTTFSLKAKDFEEKQKQLQQQRRQEEEEEEERKYAEESNIVQGVNASYSMAPRGESMVDKTSQCMQELVSVTDMNEFNERMDELLDGDPLTPLQISGKESLVDNLRKLHLNGGNRTKFVKKAYINIPYHLGPNFKKLNRYEPTYKRAEFNIDHIFANFECSNVTNKLLALGRRKLSDHRLVITEFTSQN